jgi:hypothetical protein
MADDNLINNPGVTPAPKITPISSEDTERGPGNLGDGQKAFSLPEIKEAEAPGKVSPMDLPKDVKGKSAGNPSLEEVSNDTKGLTNQFQKVNTLLQQKGSTLSEEQLGALKQISASLDPNLRTIAKRTDSEYTVAQPQKNETVLGFLSKFFDSSQGQLQKAVDFLSVQKNPNPAQMLSLQMTVQRATQKAELAASIISSGVSGFKAIMGTQLG